jgi:hypothetical protein
VVVCLDMDSFKKKDIPLWLRNRIEKQLNDRL